MMALPLALRAGVSLVALRLLRRDGGLGEVGVGIGLGDLAALGSGCLRAGGHVDRVLADGSVVLVVLHGDLLSGCRPLGYPRARERYRAARRPGFRPEPDLNLGYGCAVPTDGRLIDDARARRIPARRRRGEGLLWRGVRLGSRRIWTSAGPRQRRRAAPGGHVRGRRDGRGRPSCRELGATILVARYQAGPTRIATLRDPQGATFSVSTYIFGEPSIGLHPHDVHRLNELLVQIRDKGNTVLVVEHEPDVIAVADHVVDMGPGAGRAGGRVIYEGDVAGLRASGTLTGAHLDRHGPLKPRCAKRAARSASSTRRATTCAT